MSKDAMFEDEFDPSSLVDDTEGVIDIPLDIIRTESDNESKSIMHNLINSKFSTEFLEEHPDLKKQVEIEKGALKRLLHMMKTNEQLHDILIGAIGANFSNASLYMSLTKLEATQLSVQKQIDEKIVAIKTLFKNYQYELDLHVEQQKHEGEEGEVENIEIARGTKSFISSLREQEKRNDQDSIE